MRLCLSCFRGAIQNRLRKEDFMKKQDSYIYFVGIDCAQNKHDFAVINDQKKFLIKKGHFSNTLQGYEKFLKTVLSKCLNKDKILFGMEVTGIYGTNLYERLASEGYHVVMISPDSVKKYRDYKGLNKTDKIDSTCIAELLLKGDAQLVDIQKNGYTDLKAYIRRRNALKATCTQETNRFLAKVCLYFPDLLKVFPSGRATLKAVFSIYPTPYSIIEANFDELVSVLQEASKNKFGQDKAKELVRAARNSIVVRKSVPDGELYNIHSLIDSINSLETEIRVLENLIQSKAEEYPAYQVLLTLTGCGKITAATIIAEIGDISRFHKASQIVSLAGLYGNNSKSGSSVNKRGKISKKGSRYLRHAIYMVAEFARRNNPISKAYFTKKKNGDRTKHILAVNAVANKLCKVIYSLLKNQSTYIIQYRDLAKLSESTQNEFFQNVETDFSANTRRKKYLYEDEHGELHEFVFKSTRKVRVE